MMRKILIIVIASFFMVSCGEDEETFSDTPEIGFIKIYPTTIKEYKDKFFIDISYKDGNGDLGSANPDKTTITVTDTRIDLDYHFRLRDLSTPNGSPNIKGTLMIEMPPTAVLEDGKTTESATFKVKMEDQNGNVSNVVTTTSVTVEK